MQRPASDLDGTAAAAAAHCFARDGVAVVPGILTAAQVAACRAGLHTDLAVLGIVHTHIIDKATEAAATHSLSVAPCISADTAAALRRIQAHKSGAIPLAFSPWRLQHCALNSKLIQLHHRLWRLYAEGTEEGFASPWVGSFRLPPVPAANEASGHTPGAAKKQTPGVTDKDTAGVVYEHTTGATDRDGADEAGLDAFPLLDAVGYRLPTVLAGEGRMRVQQPLDPHVDLNPWRYNADRRTCGFMH